MARCSNSLDDIKLNAKMKSQQNEQTGKTNNIEAKSKECVLAKGICDSIDKVNNWFGNKLQLELVNEQNIKENDSISEINDFDFLLDEKEKNDVKEAEKA
uniref:Uncharacterized protein n=1 Tax=Meloidogyne javanica TaxID=6303 RepID=A0A915M683_MELJA